MAGHRCDRCGNTAACLSGGEELLCNVCLVGNTDPLAWILETARQHGHASLSLNASRQVVRGINKEPHVGIGLQLVGEPLNYQIVVQRWIDEGATALNSVLMRGTLLDASGLLRQSFQYAWDRYRSRILDCTICECAIPETALGGRHMASTYCKTCWPSYKERNSRQCGLCHAPMYRCTC